MVVQVLEQLSVFGEPLLQPGAIRRTELILRIPRGCSFDLAHVPIVPLRSPEIALVKHSVDTA